MSTKKNGSVQKNVFCNKYKGTVSISKLKSLITEYETLHSVDDPPKDYIDFYVNIVYPKNDIINGIVTPVLLLNLYSKHYEENTFKYKTKVVCSLMGYVPVSVEASKNQNV